MLNFVDITMEVPYQDRYGIPVICFGLQNAMENKPLDFSYLATDTVSDFVAKKVNNLGDVTETINLSTSLIISDGTYHRCDGLTDYATDLEEGVYYFIVNNRYKSDYFNVVVELIEETPEQPLIAISGLAFHDRNFSISWRDREGVPDICYGIQYAENDNPLPFRYLASDSISEFKLIKIDTRYNVLDELILNNSLIASDGTYHTCNGANAFSSYIFEGLYYFEVNGRYQSDIISIIELDNTGIGFDIIEHTLIVY